MQMSEQICPATVSDMRSNFPRPRCLNLVQYIAVCYIVQILGKPKEIQRMSFDFIKYGQNRVGWRKHSSSSDRIHPIGKNTSVDLEKKFTSSHGDTSESVGTSGDKFHRLDPQFENRFGTYLNSINSVFIRGMEGDIRVWNRAAEKHYGWSKSQAVGNVSHRLLHTVFPCPLSQINFQLMTKGYWEGVLLHTLSCGRRVKVNSRWEIAAEGDGGSGPVQVVEINDIIGEVQPEDSHLVVEDQSICSRSLRFFWCYRNFWIIPSFLMFLIFYILLRVTSITPLVPLLE